MSKFKKNYVVYLIIYLTLFISIVIPKTFSKKIPLSNRRKSSECYRELIQIYNEYIELENNIFKKLVFCLSDFQLQKGTSLKLILEDQFGKKWIFKPGEKAKSEIVVYHLFTLFGIEAPEIHFIELPVNGKEVFGSIQKFIDNQGNLYDISPVELTRETLVYLLRSHVFTWLLANYDAHAKNFLITSLKRGKVHKIVRIDNDGAFGILGDDELEINFSPPWYGNLNRSYYNKLWKSFMLNNIELDLNGNYEFVKFVAYFPDEFFKKLILHIFSKNKIVDLAIQRKRNLPFDYKKFYNKLIKFKKASLYFNQSISSKKCCNIGSVICGKLKAKTEKLRNIIKLNEVEEIEKQLNIAAKASIDGFKILKKVYYFFWDESYWKETHQKDRDKTLVKICDEALERLKSLKFTANNKYEEFAINCYIQEVKQIKLENKASYGFKQINKVVKDITLY